MKFEARGPTPTCPSPEGRERRACGIRAVIDIGRGHALGVVAMAAIFASGFPAYAQPAADFYRGKNVHIIVGSAAGAAYDFAGRAVGAHLSRFIPGNPNIVIENMPGAAGIRAANFLFNAAPADGGTIALALDNLVLSQFLAPDEAKYRAERFQWIGRGDRPTRVTYAWSASGLRSLDDARKREVLTGVTAPGTSSEVYPMLANSLLGARFKLISGYEGAGGLNLDRKSTRLNSSHT